MKESNVAVMLLMYDCDKFILNAIDNCAPYVKKIFIVYSELPWSAYNPDARSSFKNPTKLNILEKSAHQNKIEVIQGVWDKDDEAREECRQLAVKQGFDYLIVQDADEFYLPEDYKKNIEELYEFNADVYQCTWLIYWKNTERIIRFRDRKTNALTEKTTCPLFAISLKKEIPFEDRRLPLNMDKHNIKKVSGICHHLSFVMSDKEMHSKINTWSHADQVRKKWFKYKWLGWTPSSKYIGHIHPTEMYDTIPSKYQLPQEAASVRVGEQTQYKLNAFEKIDMFISDRCELLKDFVRRAYK